MEQKTMLQQLYNGELYPAAHKPPHGGVHQVKQHQSAQLQQALQSKLDNEGQKALEALCETLGEMYEAHDEEQFLLGFRMGARMILDIYEKDSELLQLKER